MTLQDASRLPYTDHYLLGASGRGTLLPYVVSGHGVFLESEDGRQFLDGSSGALAASLGHGRTDMADALREQAASVAFAHRTQLRNRPTEELASIIAHWAPGDLERCMFVSSGSDANELALGLTIRYWAARGESGRTAVLARDRSYHGATLGALSLTGLEERRKAMTPLLLSIARFPSPRPTMDQSSERQLLKDVEAAFAAVGVEKLAAVVIEAVSGTSGGAIVPPRSYTERIQELCRETGALLIVDEVMTGFGRTGRAFACDLLGLEPDIVTFGKGISGGYAPLAGVIVRPGVADLLDEVGGVGLGHTYMNTPLSSAVGLAASRIILDSVFLASVEARGLEVRDQLRALQSKHPDKIAAVRGVGLMNAVEVTSVEKDRTLGNDRLLTAMREAGLLLYPATPHSADDSGTHIVMVAPPLVITAGEVSELVRRFALGLEKYVEGRGRRTDACNANDQR